MFTQVQFQSTRPVRGATADQGSVADVGKDFNPRAPCGARPRPPECLPESANFNPRAPCGARHSLPPGLLSDVEFQSTRPVRGATQQTDNKLH